MKRAAALLMLCCTLSLLAQAPPPAPPAAPADPQADAKAATEEPITFSFGPQQDGGFGVVVKGSAYYPLRRFIAPVQDGVVAPPRTKRFGGFFTPSAYLYLSPEVNFSTDEGAQNQYAISARPSFQLGYQKDARDIPKDPQTGLPRLPASLPFQPWPMSAPFFEAYLDVRRQSAQAASSPDAQPTNPATRPQNVDATYYGAGIGIAVPWISRAIEASTQTDPDVEPGAFPMLRITYYRSSGATAATSVPADIKADQFSASLNFSLPLSPYANVKPRLDFEGELSRALTGNDREWQSLVKAALLLQLGGSDFKPVLSYTSGEKFGFQYDRQVLLGLALDLAGNFLGGNK